MSTNYKNYILLGCRLKYEYCVDDTGDIRKEIRELEESKEEIVSVINGMNGEYIYVGKVIAVSDKYGTFYKAINMNYDSKEFIRISDLLDELVFSSTKEYVNLTYHVFTHWS